MKKTRYIFALFTVICAFAYTSYAQTEQSDSEYFSMLSFGIETTKKQFLLAEPIPLILDF